ncbi:MAG TPA: cytochrome c1 [Candidatus Megaira endosymbiont of Nemacystus decipiens]|nr:cytochrome c1 [Candidatus Megaera endosymbiont of Nemacystus decipiens]
MLSKLLLVLSMFLVSTASASNDSLKPKQIVWPFEGIFGKFDRQATQRGAQIYMQVCAACHSLNHVYYRNLKALGFSDTEIKQIASEKTVVDGPDEFGDMFERPALPSDRFVAPYPNEEAARAANNGAYPADLSLIVKARHDGANYLYSLLTGYQEAPSDINLMPGLYYNPYFEGMQLAMPAPLAQSIVDYLDGTPATIDQMARDVTIFLQWTAEPEMEHRKSMGLKVMIFLIIFTILFYIAKRNIWRGVDLSDSK